MRREFSFFFVLCCSMAFGQRTEYVNRIRIQPNEGFVIRSKAPAELKIENHSGEVLSMESSLKIPDTVSAGAGFAYFLPKKGILYLYNKSNSEIPVTVQSKTNKKLIIENLKTYRLHEDQLPHH